MIEKIVVYLMWTEILETNVHTHSLIDVVSYIYGQ
jgi:hypothetical protein